MHTAVQHLLHGRYYCVFVISILVDFMNVFVVRVFRYIPI